MTNFAIGLYQFILFHKIGTWASIAKRIKRRDQNPPAIGLTAYSTWHHVSLPQATSQRPSASFQRALSVATPHRSCSESRVQARHSPWPMSSRAATAQRWSSHITRRLRHSFMRRCADSSQITPLSITCRTMTTTSLKLTYHARILISRKTLR